jgi:hypothetical protein
VETAASVTPVYTWVIVALGVQVVDDLVLISRRQHIHDYVVIGSAVVVPVLEALDLIVLDGHDQGVLAPGTPVLVRVPEAREMATLRAWAKVERCPSLAASSVVMQSHV